jgi:hypothetical protein
LKLIQEEKYNKGSIYQAKTCPQIVTQREKKYVSSWDNLWPPLQELEEAFEKCRRGKSIFGGDGIGYVLRHI